MSYANGNRARLRSASMGRRCLCMRKLLARHAVGARAGSGARLSTAGGGGGLRSAAGGGDRSILPGSPPVLSVVLHELELRVGPAVDGDAALLLR